MTTHIHDVSSGVTSDQALEPFLLLIVRDDGKKDL